MMHWQVLISWSYVSFTWRYVSFTRINHTRINCNKHSNNQHYIHILFNCSCTINIRQNINTHSITLVWFHAAAMKRSESISQEQQIVQHPRNTVYRLQWPRTAVIIQHSSSIQREMVPSSLQLPQGPSGLQLIYRRQFTDYALTGSDPLLNQAISWMSLGFTCQAACNTGH